MPKCKYCGARLSKFDKDICPVCGSKKPLDGVTSETVEITSNLDLSNADFKSYKPHTKMKAFLFSAFIGWSGVQFFYLKLFKCGICWFFANILIEVGLGFLFSIPVNLGYLWGFIIPLIILYIVNILLGVFIFFKRNLKDGEGEFVR